MMRGHRRDAAEMSDDSSDFDSEDEETAALEEMQLAACANGLLALPCLHIPGLIALCLRSGAPGPRVARGEEAGFRGRWLASWAVCGRGGGGGWLAG
jgi:hypothetical protein